MPLRIFTIIVLSLWLAACKGGFGRSGNNDLESLSVTDVSLDPSFSASTLDYEGDVGNSTTSVTVTATLDDEDNASMTINGSAFESGSSREISLVEGENRIRIVVTAENEFTQTYTIDIDRASEDSTDASVTALTLDNLTFNETFAPATTSYTATTNFLVRSSKLSATRSNSQATMALTAPTQQSLNSGEDSDLVHFAAGDTATAVTLQVTAGDRTTTRDYTVNVTRAAVSELAAGNMFKASNLDEGDEFGSAIAIDGDTIIVGAPKEDSASNAEDNDSAADAGAAYIYVDNGGVWSQQAYIKPSPTPEAGEQFGSAVAIYGDTAVVGAPYANSGRGEVHIYTRTGTTWSHDSLLVASDAADNDNFGFAVDIIDGYIVVGAPSRGSNQGAIYVYAEDGGDWEETSSGAIVADDGAQGDRFGAAVDFNPKSSDPEFVVGAPGDADDSVSEGAAYVVSSSNSGSSWSQTDPMLADSGDDDDHFGLAVAIYDDRVVIGAPGEDSSATGVGGSETNDGTSGAGAAYTFTRDDNDNWSQEEYFKSATDNAVALGTSVAISAEVIAVGAPNDDSGSTDINSGSELTNADDAGAVYVFMNSTEWLQEVYVKPGNTGAGDTFGNAVALQGENLVVGAKLEDTSTAGVNPTSNDNASNSGAVYLVK